MEETMKKNLILCMFVAIAMISCEGANYQDKPINYEELPQKAKTFVVDHFSNLTVSYVIQDNDMLGISYELYFTNNSEIEFDEKGDWSEVDCKSTQVPDGIIPSKILSYVKEHFTTNFIVKIELDFKHYDIELNNGLDLKFDADGNFIKIDD